MSFHRTGAYAINMGLGTDNVFRIGGWSASDNAFRMDGSGNLTMLGNVTGADFIISSDARYKNVFGNIPNALTAVNSLNGVTYTYNELSGKDTDTVRAGVLAQEVEKVLPQAVYTDADGYKSVSYDGLVPLLIEAIKELTTRVEELENK